MSGRLLVVTPLKFEMNAICGYLQRKGVQGSVVPGKTESLYFHELGLELAVGGHGKAKLAAVTQYLIARGERPEALVVAGAAGALVEEVHIGDVVVATETVEHDYKMRFGRTRPAPRHPGDQKLQRLVMAAHPPVAGYRIHGGAVASGDEDIVDKDRAQKLFQETGALCVAWEGAGGYKAAAFNEVPFLEIRAITDTADSSIMEDFAGTLASSLDNLGRAVWEWRQN
ncbi:MAG: acyltransferase [Planctomycetota bacterium]|nr:acyltransferase [Planctomycetota bacterium]MDG2144121.1 acyltransferase [Planctomycetota bacterium]